MSRYIAVQADQGKFVAIHPGGMRRHFMYEEELEALKREWNIPEARGDDLLKVQPKPQNS
jgi:hypothetical protein